MNNEIEKSPPTVSVIIRTHNRAHLLGMSIQSVLNQTYKDFELIIVDDGSTDNTEEVIKNFDDKRIRRIKIPINKGNAVAGNVGIKEARGRYIAFNDDDDEWLPEKLEKQLNIFGGNYPGLGVVYCNLLEISDKGKKLICPRSIRPEDGFVFDDALYGGLRKIGYGSSMIKKECFDEVGLLDERMHRWSDQEFFIRVSRNFKFYHLNEVLVHMYKTPGRITSNDKNRTLARKILLDKFYSDYMRRPRRKSLSKYFYEVGQELSLFGNMKTARKYLLEAIKINPFNLEALICLLSICLRKGSGNADS